MKRPLRIQLADLWLLPAAMLVAGSTLLASAIAFAHLGWIHIP